MIHRLNWFIPVQKSLLFYAFFFVVKYDKFFHVYFFDLFVLALPAVYRKHIQDGCTGSKLRMSWEASWDILMEDTVVMPAFQMRSAFHIQGCLATLYWSVSKSPYNDTHFPLHYLTVSATQLFFKLLSQHMPSKTTSAASYFAFGECTLAFYLLLLFVLFIHASVCLFIYKWQAECTLDCFLFYSRPKSRVNAMLVVDLYFKWITPALRALWCLCGTLQHQCSRVCVQY